MITKYVLSKEADNDLLEIFDYTQENFGFTKAEEYLLSIDLMLSKLLTHPSLGKRRNEIKQQL